MITVEIGDFSDLVDDIRQWAEDIRRDVSETTVRVAAKARDEAELGFFRAEYPGDNDVLVHMDVKQGRNETTATVDAEGNAVAFIEFGAGVSYPDDHPEAARVGAKHGTYGKGQGAWKGGWVYEGVQGTGNARELKDKPGFFRTKGNPAQRIMYDAAKEAEREVTRYEVRGILN